MNAYTSNAQVIKLKLRAFDAGILDQATSDIVNIVKGTGAVVNGPIPLPRKIVRFTVNRSPHVDKKSREHFEMRHFCRLLIIKPESQTIDALMKLDLAAGVEVEIKLSDLN